MLVLPLATAFAQRVDLLSPGDTWRYFKGRTDPLAGWTTVAFDDASWLEGRSGIGFGDDDDVTILDDMEDAYKTVYTRRSFSVADPSAIRKFFLRVSYDDGFVAYVNGVEAARRGLGSPGTPVRRDTSATTHEYGPMEEIDLAAMIPKLSAGRNVLAVEVHNDSLSGSDLSFTPALRAYGPGPALARGPYLQLMTTTSALVVWRTDRAGTGAIEYGSTDSLGQKLESSQVLAEHEFLLTGLEPGTDCFYRLLAGGSPLSPIYRFRTAPQAAHSRFSMAVFGDTEKLNDGLLGATALVEAMKPDLALVGGDLIRDGDADAYIFDPWIRVLPWCPFFPVPGNHDVEGNGEAYLAAFRLPSTGSGTELYYSFDYGDAHIVCLDVMESSYAAGSNQYNWLRADLAAKRRFWNFVLLHESPYSTGSVHGSNRTVRTTLCPVFDEFKVDLVFSGHNHNFERSYPLRGDTVVDGSATTSYTDPPGTIYVVTGGAGGSLYARSGSADRSWSAYFTMVNHVCRLDVDGGWLTLQAIDRTGSAFYTLQIRKSQPGSLVISGLRVEDLQGASARMVWTTDKPADSMVEYGLPGRFDRTASDPTPATEHSLTMTSLEPGAKYEARVRSRDGSGASAVSDVVSFATLPLFVRGDSNSDGRVDLSDAAQILRILFARIEPPPCPDAADANDSGGLDISDAVRVLGYLFASGAPPPPPFPQPGDDGTADSLDCRTP